MRISRLIIAPAVFVATSVAAQGRPSALEPGARVRISVPDMGFEKRQATFQVLWGDTLTVSADTSLTLPISSVTRLEVFAGRLRNIGRGAVFGAAVGVAAGLVTGFAGGGYCVDTCISPAGTAAIAAIAFGGAGAVLGAVTGAFIKTDRWEEVPLESGRDVQGGSMGGGNPRNAAGGITSL